jgi:DNA invertase Pin-like site-specific DNA recombinase
MRIAIYARVSTDDKGQDPENQLRQLRQWCESAGHELVHHLFRSLCRITGCDGLELANALENRFNAV